MPAFSSNTEHVWIDNPEEISGGGGGSTDMTATNTKLDTLHADNGAAGAAPTSGTGVLGFLRSIYDKLAATLAVTQSGTWTVQPGNTANTTAWKVDGSAVTQPVSGTLGTGLDTVAHDAVDSGNPQKVGGQARTTNPTPVADADRANFITDKLGKQVVVGSIRILKTQQFTTITSSTAETTILTAVASTFLDLYGLILTNTSATATEVTLKDATTGTTRMSFMVPGGETRGFMLPESGAHTQAVVNNNWTATCGTSVASVKITALAVQNL